MCFSSLTVRTIPNTPWVVSHSTDSNLYLWNSETQGNHVNREGSASSTPDVMWQFCCLINLDAKLATAIFLRNIL